MNIDDATIASMAAAGPPGSMTLLTAAVIVHDRDNDRVVLLRRGEGSRLAPGQWDLPSGKRDAGEPITHTAVRELREETALAVAPEDLCPVHIVHGAQGDKAPHGFVTVVFATGTWTGEPMNAEPAKHEGVCWVDVAEIPQAMVRSSMQALRCYLDGGPFLSLHGWSERYVATSP